MPDMGIASRAVGLAGVGTDFLANRWRSPSDFPSGGFPYPQDRESAAEPAGYSAIGPAMANSSHSLPGRPQVDSLGFSIPASAAEPTGYSAMGRITENNSRLNVSGDQRATKKPRIAVESTSSLFSHLIRYKLNL